MAVIARQLKLAFDQQVESLGISRAKWGLIVVVARNPGTTQRTIATALDVTEVTAGRMIDRLCADGFLERRQHATDRRAYCVYLTDAATPLLDKMSAIAEFCENNAFAGFSESDLLQLQTYLNAISKNLLEERCRADERKADLTEA